MLRKYLLTQQSTASAPQSGAKDIAAIATVWVTSEAADALIDCAFDQCRGPGGRAALPGDPHVTGRTVRPPCARRASADQPRCRLIFLFRSATTAL
jgi:hypothetical protein